LFVAGAQAQVGLTGYPPPGQLPATATNDSAATGNVGEITSDAVAQGSAIALTTGTPANLVSRTLSAGDWAVHCGGVFLPAATTTVSQLETSISVTSATNNENSGLTFSKVSMPSSVIGANNYTVTVTPLRLSFASPTTVYCVVSATFGTSTMAAWGQMFYRRMR
jgi:hypothetical protein